MTPNAPRAAILAFAILATAGADAQVSPETSGNPSFYNPSRINPFNQFKAAPAGPVAPLIPTTAPRHLHRHGHDLLPC